MATRKKTKHKTNFVLSRTIWPEPKSAPADVELVIYLQSQGRAAWLCVQSLERAQGLVRSTGAQPGPAAASLSSGSSSGSCLVLFGDRLSCSLCSSAPRPERSRASGLAGCIKSLHLRLGFIPHRSASNLCAITPLQLRRNPPGHFCLLKEGFWNTHCPAVLSKSKISVLSYNYLNTTISSGFLIYDI